jgi:methionyl-tRNA formyltransferase
MIVPALTRIVFMGTPDFAVPPLKALAGRQDFQVGLVITQPDRPKGRGRKPAPPPVKQAALALGLPIFQPEKLNTEDAVQRLSDLAPDYLVVAAYGQILSPRILDIPVKFPINIHASLLPKYRGAAPIQAAIRHMETQTGVTTMLMARGLDTGDMLLKSKTPIHTDDTARSLHDRLAVMGANLILETIDQLNENRLTPVPQDPAAASYAPMLKKEDGRIDWTLSSHKVCAHIRAMNPWPGTFTFLFGNRIKIFAAIPGSNETTALPGTVCAMDSEGIHVATGTGTVIIESLMGASGKRLSADDYLRGHALNLSDRFM